MMSVSKLTNYVEIMTTVKKKDQAVGTKKAVRRKLRTA